MNVFEQKNADLVTEFDLYVREHPDFAERIPDNSLVAMLVEGDEAFNRWSQEGAKRQVEKEQPIVYVKIKRIQPIRSRIQERCRIHSRRSSAESYMVARQQPPKVSIMGFAGKRRSHE